uniref:protein FAR1-RELATED SEQUENCE 5-like isoform X1 n=1 Tax=Erigeron canadensis TaxID=72917 RepID=UPI001CB8D923|nr:protein FAR1-RELATED SEQUENCE 5-like isoform X1 [Erigeron canadensis]
MENLFFMHQKSFEIWRAFPNVLFIDSTYKTSKYGMPFVEIVGATSIGKTFLIACEFIVNKQEANYVWVLQTLKRTLGEGWLVSLTITDKELALMNACRNVVPNDARQLCRVHIRRNIIKHCEPVFKNKGALYSFLHRWKVLIESHTIEDYITRDEALQEYLKSYPGVYRNVSLSWLSQYKELFVSCWVDLHLNFGQYNTNRVESEHALSKSHLDGQRARPHRLVECITRIVDSQHIAIRETFSKSKIKCNTDHDIPCFKRLHGFVSIMLWKSCYKRLNVSKTMI